MEARHRELERVRVAVVPVQQHDPAEADVGQRQADVAHDIQERVHAKVHEAVRPAVVVRDPERDRRADEGVQVGRRALGDLERDVDVGPQGPVVAVVLGRADRHDYGPSAALQVLAHLEVRHLRHEQRAGHLATRARARSGTAARAA